MKQAAIKHKGKAPVNKMNIYEHEETSNSQKDRCQSEKGSVWQYIAFASIPLVLVLGNSMLVPILPDMQEKMGISRFQSSLIITLFSLTAGSSFLYPVIYLIVSHAKLSSSLRSLFTGLPGVLAGLWRRLELVSYSYSCPSYTRPWSRWYSPYCHGLSWRYLQGTQSK